MSIATNYVVFWFFETVDNKNLENDDENLEIHSKKCRKLSKIRRNDHRFVEKFEITENSLETPK